MAQLQSTVVSGTLVALRTENTVSSSRNLELADRDKVVACTNTSPTNITITIPADTTTNFPIGSVVYIAKIGTGGVTLAAAGGVTVTRTGTLGSSEELYCRKRAANTWVVADQPLQPTITGGTISTSGLNTIHTFTSSGAGTLTIS